MDIAKTPKIKLQMNTQISACLIYPVYEKEEDKISDDLFLLMPLEYHGNVIDITIRLSTSSKNPQCPS